jgi:hypothetical protein
MNRCSNDLPPESGSISTVLPWSLVAASRFRV